MKSLKRKNSKIWSASVQEFSSVVENSKSIAEIVRYFGYATTGRAFKTVKNRIAFDNINCSHIPLGIDSNKGRKFNREKTPYEEIFIENSLYDQKSLKNRIIKDDLVPYVCNECGQSTNWNGKPLVLVLDHKNGKRNDHRLSNLRFLCPNCNSQQDTFSGKNNRPYHLTV